MWMRLPFFRNWVLQLWRSCESEIRGTNQVIWRTQAISQMRSSRVQTRNDFYLGQVGQASSSHCYSSRQMLSRASQDWRNWWFHCLTARYIYDIVNKGGIIIYLIFQINHLLWHLFWKNSLQVLERNHWSAWISHQLDTLWKAMSLLKSIFASSVFPRYKYILSSLLFVFK